MTKNNWYNIIRRILARWTNGEAFVDFVSYHFLNQKDTKSQADLSIAISIGIQPQINQKKLYVRSRVEKPQTCPQIGSIGIGIGNLIRFTPPAHSPSAASWPVDDLCRSKGFPELPACLARTHFLASDSLAEGTLGGGITAQATCWRSGHWRINSRAAKIWGSSSRYGFLQIPWYAPI